MCSLRISLTARASLKKRATTSGSRESSRQQDLDRDLAADARVLGEIDGAHAAFADLPLNDVISDRTADHASELSANVRKSCVIDRTPLHECKGARNF